MWSFDLVPLPGVVDLVDLAVVAVQPAIPVLQKGAVVPRTLLQLVRHVDVLVGFTNQGIRDLAIGQLIPNIQNAALIAVVAFLVVWFFARRTRFGLYVYAVGGNERVVELAGVSTRRVKVLILVVSGITAGLAGLLLTAQLGAAGPTTGSTILLDSVAAIVIGGTALSGGVGGVGRTVLGVLILTVLSNGLNQIGAADYTQTIIKGLVIIVAAVFTVASQRKLIVK
jgi:ribose transport system permease protein